MKTYLDCMVCLMKMGIDAVRRLSPDERVHHQVVQEILRQMSHMDLRTPPPVASGQIHRVIRQTVGAADPYREAKEEFTDLALKMEPELRSRLARSRDRFDFALRLAIAGNIIDFGIHHHLQERDVFESIEHALEAELDPGQVAAFRREVARAERILYIADNAGEIVLDKLLIEELGPQRVTVAVKASPIINDATYEEARWSGLTDLVRVISNGVDIPGTLLDQAPEEFLSVFNSADVIISKGQGNYETLSETNRPIWFLLKVKCPVISEDLGQPLGAIVLQKHGGQV